MRYHAPWKYWIALTAMCVVMLLVGYLFGGGLS